MKVCGRIYLKDPQISIWHCKLDQILVDSVHVEVNCQARSCAFREKQTPQRNRWDRILRQVSVGVHNMKIHMKLLKVKREEQGKLGAIK